MKKSELKRIIKEQVRNLLKSKNLNEDVDVHKLNDLVGKKVKRTTYSHKYITISFNDGSYVIFKNEKNNVVGNVKDPEVFSPIAV